MFRGATILVTMENSAVFFIVIEWACTWFHNMASQVMVVNLRKTILIRVMSSYRLSLTSFQPLFSLFFIFQARIRNCGGGSSISALLDSIDSSGSQYINLDRTSTVYSASPGYSA
jgi:hypothetical protein